MDELLQGREFEDVHDQVEQLEMVAEVKGIDELKIFKIGRFNLKGKAKELFKKLGVVAPSDWQAMKVTMLLKYGTIDKEKVRTKLDLIKQEHKQWVQAYYDQMEKLFARSKLEDAKQKRRFLSRFKLEIRELCVMRDYANTDASLNVALEVEWVLAELVETPFEMLKEEQEKNMTIGKIVMKK